MSEVVRRISPALGTEKLLIRLTPELKRALAEEAHKRGVSQSFFVASLLAKTLEISGLELPEDAKMNI